MRIIYIVILILAVHGVSVAQDSRDRGIDLFRQGDYAESIKMLEELESQGTADYPTSVYLGAAYVKSGEFKKATSTFIRAQRSNKKPVSPMKYEKSVEITNRPRASFSAAATGNDSSGIIRLAVELKEDGSVGFIIPYETSSPTLVDDAVKTAKKIRFKPAILHGKAVTSVLLFEYTFSR